MLCITDTTNEAANAPTPSECSDAVRKISAWIPLLLLPALAIAFRNRLLPWQFMWTLSVAIFAGCKWETWVRARVDGLRLKVSRSIAYLVLWPGMDAPAFLDTSRHASRPLTHEWLAAFGKTILGLALCSIVAHKVAATAAPSLLAGWLGMIGLVVTLHFGLFHAIALAWRRAGIDAQPIMRSPLFAPSVSDFWGKRWNLGFRSLTHALVFQPVRKRAGVGIASMAAFLVSGVVHDLVISVPARGGYGLPTLYFLLQGAGVLVERSFLGRRLGIDHGIRGWFFTLLCVAGPAFWLFHPMFVRNVMIPFFVWIGRL